jgi:hypothetical protein
MKKSRKLTLAASILTVCAAFALTGCSVIEGVFGHGGKELTQAALASMEYANDWSNALTVETEETRYENGKELKNIEKYIVVGTTVEYTYTDQYLNANNNVVTDTVTAIQYVKAAANPGESSSTVRIWRQNGGAWSIGDIPSINVLSFFNKGDLFSAIHSVAKARDVLIYAKYFKKNGDGYTLGYEEAKKANADLQKNGSVYLSKITDYLSSNTVKTVTLKDGKLFEVTETSDVYSVIDGTYTKQTPMTKATYTYGGSVTVPTL